jgi:hypothetical protein
MTALEKAIEQHPDAIPELIITLGCPDRYGIGVKPESCSRDNPQGVTHEQCRKCWNQEVEP